MRKLDFPDRTFLLEEMIDLEDERYILGDRIIDLDAIAESDIRTSMVTLD